MLLSTRNHCKPIRLVFVLKSWIFLDFHFFRDPLNIFGVFLSKLAVVASSPRINIMININCNYFVIICEVNVLLSIIVFLFFLLQFVPFRLFSDDNCVKSSCSDKYNIFEKLFFNRDWTILFFISSMCILSILTGCFSN